MKRALQTQAVLPIRLDERETPLVGAPDGTGAALGGLSLQDALARVVLNELSPIFIAYLDHNQFYANDSYLRLYGLARHDRKRLGDHLKILQEEVEETLKRLTESASQLSSQRSVPANVGSSHYRVQYFPIFDGRDRLVALGGVYYDITLQVETVERLRIAQQTFNDVLRSTSDWVWETDVDGCLTFVSERIVEAVGEPTALLMGRQLAELLAPDGAEPVAAMLAARQPFRDRVFKLRGKEGRSDPHRLSGVPVFDLSSGRFSGFRGTGSDITAQAAAEAASAESRQNLVHALEELNRKNESLDQALEKSHAAARAKNEFLANMSHELRTPLNAIIGFAEVISERTFGDDPTRYAAYARDIKRAGGHLLQIISDVLDLSRIESNKLAVEIGAVPLAEIMDEAKSLIVKPARDKGIDLAGMTLSRRYVLRADRTRALQIFINLLSNAVKFTPTGGAIGINTAATDGGAAVDVTVWDTGPGIPPEKQESIFGAFFQIQDKAYTRGHEGLGLGLAISRHLARVMGGDIKVISMPGHGSRFIVRLPLAPDGR
jgi:two-component system, cell cycle sensor histidine kinase PleC